MKYAVWNTLHDGEVQSVSGIVPGLVIVQIGIAYLCEKLPTTAKELMVRLGQCSHFEFKPFQDNVIDDLDEIGARGIEILSANQEGDVVTIVCVDGFLMLSYEDVEISLMEGQVISQADLEAAAHRYWEDWAIKNAPK